MQLEIERKWLVTGWPQGLRETVRFTMRQGYITVRPTVRIRSEQPGGEPPAYVLCFKKGGGLVRQEIETRVDEETFRKLENFIGRPLIEKEQRRYALPGGLLLEVNRVDADQPGEFWYAEVEYDTEAQALAWQPPAQLADYLTDEVTGQPGQSMGAYWEATRGGAEEDQDGIYRN